MGFQDKVIETKKSLGQNFFVNKNLAQQISDIVIEENPEVVVEIGPGAGSFTQFLREQNFKLILIEKDETLSSLLGEKYPKAEVRNVDFLEWEMGDLEEHIEKKILFFGSLPYNVSKKIIKKIIKSKYFNTNSYFIIQKEVAQKYTDLEPNNNFLSVSTHLYADVKRLFDISPESFKPRPKVNSSFVRFSPKDIIPELDKKAFEKFLKICFKQPRKTLHNNLKNSFSFGEGEGKELLSKSPIYKQKLYQLTQKTLQKHKINVIYANEGICKNYLLTDWTILASKEMVTLNGATYTNSYGNLNNDFYSSSSVYTGSSYSYATPDITYEDVSYNGTYSLEVGKLNDNDLLKVWEGSQSGSASGSSIEEAQMITDDDQSYIDDMVEQMLQENKLISIK